MSDLQRELGQVYADLQAGRLDDAGLRVEALLRGHPDAAATHRARAAWLQLRGRPVEAIEAMRFAVGLAPADAGLRLALGQVLASAGRLDEAIRVFRDACATQPGSAEAWYLLGSTLYGARRDAEALAPLQRAHALAPTQPMVTAALADALYLLGRHDAARALFAGLAGTPSVEPMRTLRIAQCDRNLGEPDAALHRLRESLRSPAHAAFAPVQFEIGGLHEDLGDADAAHEAYARACALQPGWPEPVAALIALRRESAPEGALREAHAALAAPDVPARSRALLHHALGKRADRMGEHARAAGHWREANRLRRAEDGALDRAAHAARIDALIALTAEGMAAGVTTPSPSPSSDVDADADADTTLRPLFIVGMPRSGTTLVEQILAAHPGAHGCGELAVIPDFAAGLPEAPFTQDRDALARLARSWRAVVRRAAPADAVVAIDKHPFNLDHLALIASALPSARIVWCLRDPRDVALSIHAESFAPDATYATDLDDIRFVMDEQARLMRHWRRVLPLPVMALRYEALVDDPEAQARRLVEFAGLPWHDDCLRFHALARAVRTHSRWQVRQPIHRGAVGRWRRYADWFTGWPGEPAGDETTGDAPASGAGHEAASGPAAT